MGDVLSALLPPAVVATVFCTFIIKLLRKEMAPRTSDGRLLKEVDEPSSADTAEAETVSQANAGPATTEDGANGAESPSAEVPDREPGPDDR
ncbi:hypothetical protein F4561_000084 [Lipingzhangella halophila]|uniref:Uncharacterized protein n=1 Tax=Lipingzhangella halophila TaxID=1783352 RepID=A0A7W7W111_9ACTN|nr:hypothetical protein [Lipingzhangella halophila]MBB4929264.1 hypothetical protein [Lipingzhangella halophila]